MKTTELKAYCILTPLFLSCGITVLMSVRLLDYGNGSVLITSERDKVALPKFRV
jgi:hypothetical protein